MTANQILSLSGPSAIVALALAGLHAAPRIVKLSSKKDGNDGEIAIDVLAPFQATEAFEIEVPADEPATSMVVRLPNVARQVYLCVEDTELDDQAAAAIVDALHKSAFDRNGFVRGTSHREVLAPTASEVYDRFALRGADGQQIAEVKLTDDQARLTAQLAYSDEFGSDPVFAFGAQGENKAYGITPAALLAKADDSNTVTLPEETASIELPAAIRRAARANSKGWIGFELENGQTAYLRSTDGGSLEIAEVKSTMTADDDTSTVNQSWEYFGSSFAVTDVAGSPTRASVRPEHDSVTYRFAPKAIPAATAQT